MDRLKLFEKTVSSGNSNEPVRATTRITCSDNSELNETREIIPEVPPSGITENLVVPSEIATEKGNCLIPFPSVEAPTDFYKQQNRYNLRKKIVRPARYQN